MANEAALRQLVRNLADSVKLLVDLVPGEPTTTFTAPAVSMNGHAPSRLPFPEPAARKPRKKKAASKKTSRPRQPTDDEEDEDDDTVEIASTTRAVSMGEVGETIGRYIRDKVGISQTFDGNAIKKLFDADVSAQTITNAMAQWIARGYVERTKSGNRFTPSVYRKLRAMEGED